jgi:ribosome-associated protein
MRQKKESSSLALAKDVARAASKMKIYDLQVITSFTDYFVIASGTSDRHVEAIADSIVMEMKRKDVRPFGVEGMGHAQWVIVDYGDVVVHIFYSQMREIYALEKLWADAKEVKLRAQGAKRKTKKGK